MGMCFFKRHENLDSEAEKNDNFTQNQYFSVPPTPTNSPMLAKQFSRNTSHPWNALCEKIETFDNHGLDAEAIEKLLSPIRVKPR